MDFPLGEIPPARAQPLEGQLLLPFARDCYQIIGENEASLGDAILTNL
jgi:hypothetical protein